MVYVSACELSLRLLWCWDLLQLSPCSQSGIISCLWIRAETLCTGTNIKISVWCVCAYWLPGGDDQKVPSQAKRPKIQPSRRKNKHTMPTIHQRTKWLSDNGRIGSEDSDLYVFLINFCKWKWTRDFLVYMVTNTSRKGRGGHHVLSRVELDELDGLLVAIQVATEPFKLVRPMRPNNEGTQRTQHSTKWWLLHSGVKHFS